MTTRLLVIIGIAAALAGCASSGSVPRPFPGARTPQAAPESPVGLSTAVTDAIIMTDERSAGLDRWRSFTGLKAVKHENLFSVNGSLMNRASPRILEGTAQLCERVETVRKHLHSD